MKKLFESIRQFFSLFCILSCLLITSCMQQVPNQRRSAQAQITGNNGTPEPIDLEEGPNYFENGDILTSSHLSINTDFTNTINLRGKEIHEYMYAISTSTNTCLVAYFPQSVDNKLMVLMGTPLHSYSISTNKIEYYYLLSPANKDKNQTFCQEAGLISTINAQYPGESISYSLADMCPNCTARTVDSSELSLYTPTGTRVDKTYPVNISYLNFRLLTTPTPTEPVTNSCSSYSECPSSLYDCCSLGQCVRDGELKLGTDTTSSDYIQSVIHIADNPANIIHYPHIYHICGNVESPTVPPTPIVDTEDETAEKLRELSELYYCTTLQQGEMSICSVTYDNPTSGGVYPTTADDSNFLYIYTGVPDKYPPGTIPMPDHSIVEVIHAGETLYKDRAYTIADSFDIIDENFVLSDQTKLINLNHNKDPNALHDNLIIKYMVDGSCQGDSGSLAKCSKYYVQGQNLARVDDHYPASNQFILPYYADIGRKINVTVDDLVQQVGLHWKLSSAKGNNIIQFIGGSLQVSDGQKVKIDFYVNSAQYNVLNALQTARDRINQICPSSGNTQSTLTPVKNSNDEIIDFICYFPDPDVGDVPMQETIYLNSKTVPMRFFDSEGTEHSELTSSLNQEGNLFEYTSGDLSKPNNLSQYVGFNEIYGTISTNSNSAIPAYVVSIEPNKSYDIFVSNSSFSTCSTCGNDYYAKVKKLFPDNFINNGGGYVPDPSETSKFNTSVYRADDLVFGRACFVPASMIPWTHRAYSERQRQRLKRLEAQHFLFANGYQRDWYGFDYGSLIGSFDGVKWFAVGHQRRIKAETTKLYLAVNAYFGDLTRNETFQVTVSDSTINPLPGASYTSNFNSSGAQCQKYHICDTDKDCVAKLGWDYSCQSISSLQTSWPVFDNNGLEAIDAYEYKYFIDLFGKGDSNKRCVYRGRGAPCRTNYDVSSENISYSKTTQPGIHACNSNNYCQAFTVSGSYANKFNNKISRYAQSIQYINLINNTSENTFGLGAKIIGRPFEYGGDQPITSTAKNNLNINLIDAVCVPGRNPVNSNTTLLDQNSNYPGSDFLGDQVSGIGMTSQSLTHAKSEYLSSCSILDTEGNYYHLDKDNFYKTLGNYDLVTLAGSQAISTNSMKIFESIMDITGITKDFTAEQIINPVYEKDRCLRAPGSVCHTNLDCAPSDFFYKSISSINPTDTSFTSILNEYELRFWQEKLICGNENQLDDEDYDLTDNRCCRETGNTLTIGTYQDQTGTPYFNKLYIPGIDIPINASYRYSRNSTAYEKYINDSSNYPTLEAATDDECAAAGSCYDVAVVDYQYNSFAYTADKTCCSGHWIRNFDKDGNGGGHEWGPDKLQNINKRSFKCLNWDVCAGASCSSDQFDCSHVLTPDDANCNIKATSLTEAKEIFDWFGTLELLGIPQITVKTDDFSTANNCRVNPEDQSLSGAGIVIPDTIISVTSEPAEYADSSSRTYYSGIDSDNFTDSLKTIFSKDEITCCIPAGEEITQDQSENMCCTGMAVVDENDSSSQDNAEEETEVKGRCSLKDYTDLSVYYNRYVSSAAKSISGSLFDQRTGYLKSSDHVATLACQQQVCASNVLAYGVSLAKLKVPGHVTNEYEIQRFIDSNELASNLHNKATYFDNGLRWNTHVYCVPEGFLELTAEDDEDSDNGDIFQVYDCRQNDEEVSEETTTNEFQ